MFTHFKKSCRIKIYSQMQDQLLYDFENVTILDFRHKRVKEISKKNHGICYFYYLTFKLRQFAYIYIHVKLFFSYQKIN